MLTNRLKNCAITTVKKFKSITTPNCPLNPITNFTCCDQVMYKAVLWTSLISYLFYCLSGNLCSKQPRVNEKLQNDCRETVRVRVCLYSLSICVYVFISVYRCAKVCMYFCMYVCICGYLYVCDCVYRLYLCVGLFVCECQCVSVPVYS